MTGGYDGDDLLSTTEILTSLTSQWSTLESASLPYDTYGFGFRSVSVDNNIIVTGIGNKTGMVV